MEIRKLTSKKCLLDMTADAAYSQPLLTRFIYSDINDLSIWCHQTFYKPQVHPLLFLFKRKIYFDTAKIKITQDKNSMFNIEISDVS